MTLVKQLRKHFELDRHFLTFLSGTTTRKRGYVVERLALENGSGERVRAILTRPENAAGQLPAILYIHAHGNRYEIGADELLAGRPALQGALGGIFAGAGFVTMAIDLPAFGQRSNPGESARSKALLWRGHSLAGQMLGEQSAALTYLGGRPDVLEDRIGVFGISMGATLGYWLSAVDPRIACAMHLCCFADFDSLIASGAHDLHGPYLTIPGLLEIASNGQIAGLVAPRPQFICIGDKDPLTPPRSVDIAFAQTRASYLKKDAGHRLNLVRDPATGHQETPLMRELMLKFAIRHLQRA